MKTCTEEEIGHFIAEFSAQPFSTVFAGAGIGRRVGLPDWTGFMEHLASICEEFDDDLSAQLIRQRLERGHYLEAASTYTTCNEIPVGEKYKRLAEPFSRQFEAAEIELLEALVSLPFKAIVTTNYDRSFHEAFARFKGSSAIPLELKDNTLKNSATITEYFIARIHGRAELPDTMVFDNSHYADLKKDIDYEDFLISILRQRPLLFLGFSFVDPAINSILDVFENNFGPTFPTLHAAIVPEDAPTELTQRLARANIEVKRYSPKDKHKSLWQALRIAFRNPYEEQATLPIGPILPTELPKSELHRFLAFTYAKTKASEDCFPAHEIVQDGIVLSILEDDPASTLEKSVIPDRVREALKTDEDEAKKIALASIERLVEAGEIVETTRTVQRRNSLPNDLRNALNNISEAVSNRVRVLHRVTLTPEIVDKLSLIWEKLFIVRAWDLAPQYAGSIASHGLNLESVIESLLQSELTGMTTAFGELRDAMLDIMRRPEPAQADDFAEIARAAFLVQITLTATRNTLFHPHVLPSRIHLDASVLMPAIAEGHPFYQGYKSAIQRLKEAANNSAQKCELIVGTQFMDEIIAHRQKGIELVNELGLEEEDNLTKHILYYGAENTNVFVGAYASRVADDGEVSEKFSDFLEEVAPYNSELALASFLSEQGINAQPMDYFTKDHSAFTHILNALKLAYENDTSRKEKDAVLIRHEAQQLTSLFLDLQNGVRSVFITADLRLQRLIQGSDQLRDLSGSVLSHFGFIGLVDFLVGLKPDREFFSRIVWGSPRTSTQKQIIDYFITRTLGKYDDAMAREMPQVLKDVIDENESQIAQFPMNNATDTDSASEVAKFVDRMEDEYFEKMRVQIDKRDSETDRPT